MKYGQESAEHKFQSEYRPSIVLRDHQLKISYCCTATSFLANASVFLRECENLLARGIVGNKVGYQAHL